MEFRDPSVLQADRRLTHLLSALHFSKGFKISYFTLVSFLKLIHLGF